MNLNTIIADLEANGFSQDSTNSKNSVSHTLNSENIMIHVYCSNPHTIIIRAEYKDSFYGWDIASFKWDIDTHTKEFNKQLTRHIILTLLGADTAKSKKYPITKNQ